MDWLHDLIGRDSATIEWWQMSIRAAVIFIYLLVPVVLHVLLAALALKFSVVGLLAKGRAVKLMEAGRLLHDNLRRARITDRDLHEQLRPTLKTDDLDEVSEAYLERGGDVSFIRR